MLAKPSYRISRRNLLRVGSLAVAGTCFKARTLLGQDGRRGSIVVGAFKEAAEARVTVRALRRNISVIFGAGGNIAVLTGPDGKILVDAEITTARPHVWDGLKSMNEDPVTQLINTHWHFDHTGGNEWLHSLGAKILAHENTRKHLSRSTRVAGN
jgi:glyoxylase-like metal-dependent hydrolase (beta-lactamase superfamily II)